MIRIVAIAALILAVIWLVWRNLGAAARLEAEQRRAWDEPLQEGSAFVLSAPPRLWWWLGGLGLVTAVVAITLWESLAAGAAASDSILHILVLLALCAIVGRRLVQISERVTVTWERIASRNILGARYDMALDDAEGVTESDRTILIAFRGGRVLALSPWLDGRFWLGRELRRRLGDEE